MAHADTELARSIVFAQGSVIDRLSRPSTRVETLKAITMRGVTCAAERDLVGRIGAQKLLGVVNYNLLGSIPTLPTRPLPLLGMDRDLVDRWASRYEAALASALADVERSNEQQRVNEQPILPERQREAGDPTGELLQKQREILERIEGHSNRVEAIRRERERIPTVSEVVRRHRAG